MSQVKLCFRECDNASIEIRSVFEILEKLKAFILLKNGGGLMQVILYLKGFGTLRAFEMSLALEYSKLRFPNPTARRLIVDFSGL